MAFHRWIRRGRIKGPIVVASVLMVAILATPSAGAPPPAIFAKWMDGTASREPATQVQAIDGDTYVIRQSIKSNFEAPFLYLLFGRDKAMLIDSGAESGVIRPTVDRIIAEWLILHHRDRIPLVIAHSHSHGDHVAADATFRTRQDTTVVGLTPTDVSTFFGLTDWPNAVASFDLGGRMLSIIPTPGHQIAHVMIFDPQTSILISGDALYPGRLYVPVNHMDEARASIDRVAAFTATHPVRAVLGAHVEMTGTPGMNFVQEAQAHPSEHRLELSPESIIELQKGLNAPLEGKWRAQVHDDFIIYPVPARAQ